MSRQLQMSYLSDVSQEAKPCSQLYTLVAARASLPPFPPRGCDAGMVASLSLALFLSTEKPSAIRILKPSFIE